MAESPAEAGAPGPTVVDALGLLCPLPVLRCERALRRLEVGGVVELLSDDEGILRDLPAWCSGKGHAVVSIEPTADSPHAGRTAYRCIVRRGSSV